jgi:DNA modification methylase
LLALSVPTIFWGGNNFSAKLPRGGWLCWDKRCSANADKMFGSPFELAWISDTRKFKMLRLQHGGVINADGYGHKRLHPTQKPINLMLWCIEFIDGTTILDPFMGSGTTGVACLKTKRRFIGIEINPAYYAIAVMRCKATYGDNHE